MTSDDRPVAGGDGTRAAKASYVGVPAVFKLQLACRVLYEAYCQPGGNVYHVGSSLLRPDWRDVDVVLILPDKAFESEFPDAVIANGSFELDTKWLLNSITISEWLSKQSGLPVDFKVQPMTWANARHGGQRNPLAMKASKLWNSDK